jgi:hypothetical protein
MVAPVGWLPRRVAGRAASAVSARSTGGAVGAGAEAVLVTGRFGQPASNSAKVTPHTRSRAGRTGLVIVWWLLH